MERTIPHLYYPQVRQEKELFLKFNISCFSHVIVDLNPKSGLYQWRHCKDQGCQYVQSPSRGSSANGQYPIAILCDSSIHVNDLVVWQYSAQKASEKKNFLRVTQGLHAAMRVCSLWILADDLLHCLRESQLQVNMEQTILSQYRRLPGFHSEFLGLEVMDMANDRIGFEDFLNGSLHSFCFCPGFLLCLTGWLFCILFRPQGATRSTN